MESSLGKRIVELKEMADGSLRASDTLLKDGIYAVSISRSYYAMFYMVDALVQSKGHDSKSHTGLSTLFSKLFIKTGLFNEDWKDIYMDAMDDRRIADYESFSTLSKEKAIERLREAKEFTDTATKYLEKQGLL